jgi:hypothetical protein
MRAYKNQISEHFPILLNINPTNSKPMHVHQDKYELLRSKKLRMPAKTTFSSNFSHFQCIFKEIHENLTLGCCFDTISKTFTLDFIFRNSKMETCQ